MITPRVTPLTGDEIAEIHRREAERQKRVDAAKLNGRVFECRRASNVPQRYARASLDDAQGLPELLDDDAGRLAEVRLPYANVCESLRTLQDNPATVALLGPRGPGKTFMACGLVNAFVRAGRWAKYMTAADYIAMLRATWGSKAAGIAEEKAVEFHAGIELLVLDEMQERRKSEDEDLVLTRIVDKRYAAGRSTVLISNQDVAGFIAGIGTSIADRINDGGGIICCEWPTLRGRIGVPAERMVAATIGEV